MNPNEEAAAACDVCGERLTACSCLERELPKDRTDADGRTGAEIFGTPDRNPYP